MEEKTTKSALDQSWYDRNRERFDAETIVTEEPMLPHHHHHIERINGTEVECKGCKTRWTDPRGAIWPQ